MDDYTNDDMRGFLQAKLHEIASTCREIADIRLAEMKSVVRLFEKWDNKRLDELAFQVQKYEENARYCNAISLAVEDPEIGKAIFKYLTSAAYPKESTLEAVRIVNEQRCSYSGRLIQYVDGDMVYRETEDVVPVDDRPR